MVRLAANLSFLFVDVPIADRFAKAARCGFAAVECNDIYELPVPVVRQLLADNDLQMVLINVGQGAREGDLGTACCADRRLETAQNFARSLHYAVALEVPAIHYLAGRRPLGVSREAADGVFCENLARDADLAAAVGITLTLEPLNAHDRPDYHLVSMDHATALIDRVGRSNVGLQLDLYHAARRGEDVARAIDRAAKLLAHVQIAGPPLRQEPIDATWRNAAFDRLDATGFAGWVGCEYHPVGDTAAGLAWASEHLAICRDLPPLETHHV